jgi:hypothetical protein
VAIVASSTFKVANGAEMPSANEQAAKHAELQRQQQQQNLTSDLQQHLRADPAVQTNAQESLSNAAAAAAPRVPAPRAPVDLRVSLEQYLHSPRKRLSPAPALPTPPPRRSVSMHRRSSKSSGSLMRWNMQKYMDFDSSIGRSTRSTVGGFGVEELQLDTCVPALKRNDSEVRAQERIDLAPMMRPH